MLASQRTPVTAATAGTGGWRLGVLGLAEPTWTLQAAIVLAIAALTAAAAQISLHVPFTTVPFTLQPIAVLLTAALAGARLACAGQVLYLVAGLSGLPVFAPSPILAPGLGRLLGPTGGYLISYPFAALVVGALSDRGYGRRYVSSLAVLAAGLVVIYAGGVAWLAAGTLQPLGWRVAAIAGALAFLPADAIKLLAGAALLRAARRTPRAGAAAQRPNTSRY